MIFMLLYYILKNYVKSRGESHNNNNDNNTYFDISNYYFIF
jgi:hypothetical protein